MSPVASTVTSLLAQSARLRQAGRSAEAISPLREAALLQPSSAVIQHDLGVAYLECGQLSEAVAALRRSLSGNPQPAKTYWRIGIALERQRDFPAAIGAYRQAVRLLPSLADAQFRLAALLEATGHRTEAIGCFRRAAASAAKTSLGRMAAARAFVAEGRDEDAERTLRHLLALDASNGVAHEMLGTVLADSGRFEEARASYERAVQQGPYLAGAFYDLVRCRRLTPGDTPLVTRMQAVLEQPALEPGQRLKLLLALGKAADDFGQYETAMRHFDAADEVRRLLLGFDMAGFNAKIDRLIQLFDPALIERAARLGSPDPTPVMILGMPRSGTTLVEQIISSHPDIAAGGELHFWNRRGAMMEHAGRAGLSEDVLTGTAADYLRFIRALAPAAQRITDKMPMNFLWAGLVHLVFPRAAIIHCRRNPVDTALSIHQTHFSPLLGFPTGGNDLVGYYRGYERLMAHWRNVLPPDRFIEIDYETLTQAPEATTRTLVAAIGLTWNDACLQPERNQRIIKTASKWQARQPIYQTATGRWRRYEPFLGALAALIPEQRQ